MIVGLPIAHAVTVNSEWILTVFDALVAAVLINAGVTKIVAPGHLLRASAEVLAVARWLGGPFVLGLGGTELAVAVALLVRPFRLPAAIVITMLGICFATAGLVGLLRRSSVPCGCFGGTSRLPLGWANIAIGTVLATVWPVNLLARQAMPGYPAAAVLFASMAATGLCLWLNRRLIARLVPASRTRKLGGELT